MREIWKDVPGYAGKYKVSSLGRIKSFVVSESGKILVQSYDRYGYKIVGLYAGRQKSFPVHRVVLLAFRGPRPLNMDSCHNNGVKTDNRLLNLRYDSRKNNHADTKRHGMKPRGESHANSKLTDTEVKAIRRSKSSCAKAAADFGVCPMTISLVRRKLRWAHVK